MFLCCAPQNQSCGTEGSMGEGYRHPCEDFPCYRHLHDHRWDLLEERGEEERRRPRGEEEAERRGKGESKERQRGRGLGVREKRGGGRGVGKNQVLWDEMGRKKKQREWKLRQDSRLSGHPHLFIDLRIIECDWVAAWQQKPAWWLQR